MNTQLSTPSAAENGDQHTRGDPLLLADQLIAKWRLAPTNIIGACRVLLQAIDELEASTPSFARFTERLVEGRVLSENEALSGFRANGKLSMLKKIGEHAESLLNEAVLPLLPPHYSVLYQVALLIERAGLKFTECFLKSLGPGFVREDIINAKPPTMPDAVSPAAALPSQPIDVSQLFLVTPSKRDFRLLSQAYAEPSALDRSLARPQSAENAGLVVLLPLLSLGAIERVLLPLLGFSKPTRILLLGQQTTPDIHLTNGLVLRSCLNVGRSTAPMNNGSSWSGLSRGSLCVRVTNVE